jgi:hypothetical protein
MAHIITTFFTGSPELCLEKSNDPTDAISILSLWWGFECSRDPESSTGGSVATGRATQVGQVKR